MKGDPNNNLLVALDIVVGDKRKHVGKVGVLPLHNVPVSLAGKRVLYKETSYSDLFCRNTQTYSMDMIAMHYAKNIGAELLVIWIFSHDELAVIKVDDVLDSRVSNLGERSQYRFPPGICWHQTCSNSLPIGWTNRTVVVDNAFAKDPVFTELTKRTEESLFEL